MWLSAERSGTACYHLQNSLTPQHTLSLSRLQCAVCVKDAICSVGTVNECRLAAGNWPGSRQLYQTDDVRSLHVERAVGGSANKDDFGS